MYAIASEHWRGSPCALTCNWFAVPAKCPLHVYTGGSTIECKVDKHDPELQEANVRCQHDRVGHWSGALVRFTCCDGSQVPRRYLLSSLQAPLSELLGALHCALKLPTQTHKPSEVLYVNLGACHEHGTIHEPAV